MQRIIISLITAIILTACGSTPKSSDQAISTASRGESATQSQISSDIANLSLGEKFDLAAERLSQRDFTTTQVILNSIDFDLLKPAEQTQYGLIAAEFYLLSGSTLESIRWLNGDLSYVFDNIERADQIRVSQWRATAWEYSGKFLAATRERIFISHILDKEQAAINHELIWADLQFVSEEDLFRIAEIDDGSVLTGWAQLAYSYVASGLDLEAQVDAISRWQAMNKGHPAAKALPGGLNLLQELVLQRPKHIGIMLPLSGALKNSGEAILNGFMAAYYQAAENNRVIPKITFIDTDEVRDVKKAYDQLAEAGVQLIVGPLEKSKVKQLQDYKNAEIPVLALNTSGDLSTEQSYFYQFGLSPEDEATQVAVRASQLGYTRAAILVPANTWGDRVINAFKLQFHQLGGHVVNQVQYEDTANRELLLSVRKLLNLDSSLKRITAIESILGQKVESEPRRRKDIDFIFMAATPTDARQLKPLLDFQYAANIPVFGVSTLYSGKASPDLDKDIEGVQFLDMPWQIQLPELKRQSYQVFGELSVTPYSRLYAMGADIFVLYPRLKQLSFSPSNRVHGYTGVLSIDSNNIVKRELSWAVIHKGLAEPVKISDE